MAQLKAVSFRVYIGATPVVITGEQNGVLTINQTPADTSSKDNDWETNIEGKRNWSISSDGVFEVDDTAHAEIRAAILDGADVAVKMRDTDSSDQYSGNAKVVSFEDNGSDGEAVKYSINLTGNGALTWATY